MLRIFVTCLILISGTPWLQGSWGDRCVYDEDGVSLNPSCTIEPLCRNYTTFGDTACMRDHYYQLWDLEKNFGEKTFCKYFGPILRTFGTII